MESLVDILVRLSAKTKLVSVSEVEQILKLLGGMEEDPGVSPLKLVFE